MIKKLIKRLIKKLELYHHYYIMKNNNYHDVDEMVLNIGESIKIDNKIIKYIEITYDSTRLLECDNCDL